MTWDMLADILIKFSLATVLAGTLGLERERTGRSAGLRTHILVCLGSTLAVMLSDMVAQELGPGDAAVGIDRSRIAAGVLTGVGFLGAGTIINEGSIHRGLTTAAMIWFVAALGIAIGLGFYIVAFLATLFALLTVVCLRYAVQFLPAHETVRLDMRLDGPLSLVDDVEAMLKKQGFRVNTLRLRTNQNTPRIDMRFELISRGRPDIERLAAEMQDKFKGVQRIEFER